MGLDRLGRRLHRTAAALGLLACGHDPVREADRAYTVGTAQVESVEVDVRLGSSQVAVARVSGLLPDACTELEAPWVRRNGPVFEVTLATRRPFGARCPPEPVPFEQRVRLRIDPGPGAYVVNVNGVRQGFAARPGLVR
jgi:hypothetical protein